MRRFQLVIPCYNEAPTLRGLVRRAAECARERGWTPEDFQLVLVDNGSTDETPETLACLGREPGGEYLRPVTVTRNRGYGHGILAGLRETDAAIVGWTHADGQCDLGDAFRAWDTAWRADVVVKGRRVAREPGPWVFSRGFDLAARLILGARFYEINAQPKVFSRRLLARLTHPPDDYGLDLYLLLQASRWGWKTVDIPVRLSPRAHGQSRWSATLASRFRVCARMLRLMIQYR
jgi:glycosyltransferase involved in cell wall biosynthesis